MHLCYRFPTCLSGTGGIAIRATVMINDMARIINCTRRYLLIAYGGHEEFRSDVSVAPSEIFYPETNERERYEREIQIYIRRARNCRGSFRFPFARLSDLRYVGSEIEIPLRNSIK